jgi:hypothetical protein
MAIIDTGGSTAGKADVDAFFNLKTTLPQVKTQAGYARLTNGELDEDLHIWHGHMATSLDSYAFFDTVDGAALNTNKWLTSTATMTITQASGFITLNAGSSVATSVYAILSSIKQIPFYPDCSLHHHIAVKPVNLPIANAVGEVWYGNMATTAAPTDGIGFRWGSDGTFKAIMNFGGVETASAALTIPSTSVVTYLGWEIEHQQVHFYVNHALVATMATTGNPVINTARMPINARVYTLGSAPASAPQLQIADVSAVHRLCPLNEPLDSFLGGLGNGSHQSPLTAFGQTAQWANSGAPANASLNNAVSSYTTLGGKFLVTGVASAETDFPLFGFQIPAGYQFVPTGIHISGWVSVIFVGGPMVMEWGIGLNSSNQSLATTDGAGTWAPRRVPVGQLSFPVTAAVGTAAVDIVRTFGNAYVVDSGRFFHVILRMPSGVTSGAVRGNVAVTGYFK